MRAATCEDPPSQPLRIWALFCVSTSMRSFPNLEGNGFSRMFPMAVSGCGILLASLPL